MCAPFPEFLQVWEWLPTLCLQSDLVVCQSLQSHCLSLRTLNISSPRSQVFLLLQIKSKANMTFFLGQRWIAHDIHHPHLPFSNRRPSPNLSYKRAPGQRCFPSLLCSQVCPCDYALMGEHEQEQCVSLQIPLRPFWGVISVRPLDLWFSDFFLFFSAYTVIFLKHSLSVSNLVFSGFYFVLY